ncbi:twin-arginine translocase subunit TatC [uncultured Prevotella sp.]|uniref:twin-arginine translocase subunit TatC n=1 Tax=uncultured Prevotella sp. TaxID=159272 RepID=UPI00261FAB75|nr:twin-arginine translocase subunit TatC [uncultured Prevotella sp.]
MSNRDSNGGEPQTFWEHLEVLRGCILRMIAAAAAASAVAFGFKEELFGIVLAPADSSFITYRLLGAEPFKFQLINTGLTEQFMIHLKTALTAGLLIASPYILYLLFRFVSPALYENERRYSVSITLWAYIMFLVGVAVNYFVVFPLTVRFLGTYQVSTAVMNMLTISSYMDTLLGMSLVMGAVFEIPIISWLLARFGLLKAQWMCRYRRHAVIVILIVAAVITPTSDMFTMLIVSLPIWLLYEASIMIVRVTEKK